MIYGDLSSSGRILDCESEDETSTVSGRPILREVI